MDVSLLNMVYAYFLSARQERCCWLTIMRLPFLWLFVLQLEACVNNYKHNTIIYAFKKELTIYMCFVFKSRQCMASSEEIIS